MTITRHGRLAGWILLFTSHLAAADTAWVLGIEELHRLDLLPRFKGAIVAFQWAKRMHGFGGETDDTDPEPQPAPPT